MHDLLMFSPSLQVLMMCSRLIKKVVLKIEAVVGAEAEPRDNNK